MPKIYPLGHQPPDGWVEFAKLVVNKTAKRSHTAFSYDPYDREPTGACGFALIEMVGLPDPVSTIQEGDRISLGLISREPFAFVEGYRWEEVRRDPIHAHLYALFEAWNDARIWRASVLTKVGAAQSALRHGPENLPDTVELVTGADRQVVYDVGEERRHADTEVSVRPLLERALSFMVGKKFRVLPVGKDDGKTRRRSILFPSYCKFKENTDDADNGRFLEEMALKGYVDPSVVDQFYVEDRYACDPLIRICAVREDALLRVLDAAVKEAKKHDHGE